MKQDTNNIPTPALEKAQKLLIDSMQQSIMLGVKSRPPSTFVVQHNRKWFVFMTGILPGTKFPDWYRHIAKAQVWIPLRQVGSFLDYTVFELEKAKVKVKTSDGGFWIYGLDKEPSWVSSYCTLDSVGFWTFHPYGQYELEFLSQYLLSK